MNRRALLAIIENMERNDFMIAASKGALSGAYLLHGEEEFLKENAVSSALKLIDSAMRDLNVDILETAQATAVIAAAETLPFMAERRVVLCRAMPKDDDAARLAAYAERVPESTVLLFYIKGKADGRSAFVKAMAKLGRSIDFAPLNEIEARRYVQKRAKTIDAPITEQEAAFFVSLAGTDCAALYNELDKAASYAGAGNEITREVIAKIVTRDLDYVVFEVLDQFIANRATDGLRTLNGLMENGEKPLMIAERLRDKAKLTLQARQLIDKRIGKDEITRRLGVSSGYAWRVSDSAKRLSTAQVAALTDAAEALSRVTTMQLTGQAKAEDALIRALMLLAHR